MAFNLMASDDVCPTAFLVLLYGLKELEPSYVT